LLVAVVIGASLKPTDEFAAFMKKYNKQYASETELAMRMGAFYVTET
jgi:hypothetical protein